MEHKLRLVRVQRIAIRTLVQFCLILVVSMFVIFITPLCLQQVVVNEINSDVVLKATTSVIEMKRLNNKNHNAKFEGYIVSRDEMRFNNTKATLAALDINCHQYVPHEYDSNEVVKAVTEYVFCNEMVKAMLENPANIQRHAQRMYLQKCMSNRMAFFDLLHDFVDDKTIKNDSWRLFFEDDADVHPKLKPSEMKYAIQKGMELAANDGILFLGICLPLDCEDQVELGNLNITAARCVGICAHALAFTKWKAKIIASLIDELLKPGNPHRTQNFDEMLQFYSVEHKILALGLNLKSPIPDVYEHYGLFFQNRGKFPSFINEGLQL
jgi:hypothetical protein